MPPDVRRTKCESVGTLAHMRASISQSESSDFQHVLMDRLPRFSNDDKTSKIVERTIPRMVIRVMPDLKAALRRGIVQTTSGVEDDVTEKQSV